MNISHNLSHRRVALWLMFLLGSIYQVSAQSFVHLTTAKDVAVLDTFSGNNINVSLTAPSAKHGSVTRKLIASNAPLGNRTYEVRYQPDMGFTGVDTFALEVNYNGNYPYLTYRFYIVKVYPSIVKTKSDYAQTNIGTPVLIDVLANDFASQGGLALTGFPLVNHGSATMVGNQLQFTPSSGFSGLAHVNYQTCDALFECKTGSVDINVIDNSVQLASSVEQISTAKNKPVSRVLLDTGFTVSSNPTAGNVILQGGYRYTYSPNNTFVGLDSFVLENANHSPVVQQTVYVDVFDTPTPNSMAMDDYYYTPVNQPISFNVRQNDFGNAYKVQSFTNPASSKGTLSALNSPVNGHVTFTPAAGYTGVVTFNYTIYNSTQGNSSLTEVATVHVVVGDLNPALATFDLTTPQETPIVINYELPFLGYDFYVTDAPDHGTLNINYGFSTYTAPNGQTVSGYGLLIYTPTIGYIGTDEITLDYCLNGGGNCYTVKLDVNIIEPITGSAPFCVDDCVWTGDVNNDGIVNNKDILPLGYFMGEEGNTRSNAALEWYGQFGTDWANPYYALPFDMKHADTDGNGSITCDDTTAVSMFYGEVHNLFPSIPSTNKGLPFFPQWPTTPVGKGDHVVIPIALGNANYPVSNIYGLTYDVNISPVIVDSATHMDYLDYSFLNADAPYIEFSKRPRLNRMESAFTRTNGIAANGYGMIGVFEFIVEEVVDDVKATEGATVTITIDNPSIMLADGSTKVFESQSFDIPLRLGASDPIVSDVDFQVFPNPTTDLVRLFLNGTHTMEQVQIFDVMGKQVYDSGAVVWENAELSVKDLPSGVYMVHAKTSGGVVNKKLQVLR